MALFWENGTEAAVALRFQDSAEACAAYYEDGHVPIYVKPGLENAPVISNYGASSGSGNHKLLTLNANQLPIDITVSGNSTNTNQWTIRRIVGSVVTQVAAGIDQSPETVRAFYQEALTAQFKPDSTGWAYTLLVENLSLIHI